jgi:hypothetical protein
MNVQ